MKMYIANGTKQVQHFCYRLPGNWHHLVTQVINEGAQIKLADDHLQPEDVQSILMQHEKYGLIKAEDVDRTKPFTGMCYSIDKPVAVAKIEKLFVHNQEVLEQRAEETLRATALANNQLLENRVAEAARNAGRPLPGMSPLDISITEEAVRGDPAKTAFFRDGNKGASGIRLAREGGESGRGFRKRA